MGDLVARVGRLRQGELGELIEEIKETDAVLALAAIKCVRLIDEDEGRALLDAKPELLAAEGVGTPQELWAKYGFSSRDELLIAFHASKPDSKAPMGLRSALVRHEVRGKMVKDEGGNEPASISLPRAAVRSPEQEAQAPEIELRQGGRK